MSNPPVQTSQRGAYEKRESPAVSHTSSHRNATSRPPPPYSASTFGSNHPSQHQHVATTSRPASASDNSTLATPQPRLKQRRSCFSLRGRTNKAALVAEKPPPVPALPVAAQHPIATGSGEARSKKSGSSFGRRLLASFKGSRVAARS